jgi:hypothetical protein
MLRIILPTLLVAGNDDVLVDEGNGVFTDAEQTTIESGARADVVAGGRGAETIAAGDDAGALIGLTLEGNEGVDVLTGASAASTRRPEPTSPASSRRRTT